MLDLNDGTNERLGNVNTDSQKKLVVAIRPPLEKLRGQVGLIRHLCK